MPNINISISTKRPLGVGRSSVIGSEAGRYLANIIEGVVAGTIPASGLQWCANEAEAFGTEAAAGCAIAGLAASAAAGSVGTTNLAGSTTDILVTAAGGDAATMTLLAAAIRAATAVNRVVTATNLGMAATLASVTAGQYLDVCGIRFTAVGATATKFGDFLITGTDTQDAAALCLAINSHPETAPRYRAVNVVGKVYVFPSTNRTLTKAEAVTNPGSFSTITINTREQTAVDVCAVIALVPGPIGNLVDMAAVGTGMTAVTNGAAGFLGHGNGGGAVPYFVTP